MQRAFFYSPLSPSNVIEHQALLILFILKELINHPDRVLDEAQKQLGTLHWTLVGTPSDKLREHFSLLPIAFPSIPVPKLKAGKRFQDLILRMAPFIRSIPPSENILLFLFRHQNNHAVKQLLDKLCPEGIERAQEKMAENFKKRGRWIHLSKTA